jgi:hypothetical protein
MPAIHMGTKSKDGISGNTENSQFGPDLHASESAVTLEALAHAQLAGASGHSQPQFQNPNEAPKLL